MRKMLMALALLGLTTASANAQDVDAAQNKLLAKRAAQADCYRKLAETINGVQITSDTLVRDFVTESDQIRTGVDQFIRGVRLGQRIAQSFPRKIGGEGMLLAGNGE